MKKYFPLFVVFVTGLTMANENKITPLPLPKKIRVESTVPRQKVWNTLTERQKLFAYHLIQAGREGKTLLAMQIHRHGLALQGILLASLSEANIKETKKLLGKEGFEEYLMYAAKFMDSSGPYASSNRKYTLLKTKNATFATLVNKHGANLPDATKKEIIALVIDPTFETRLFPEDPKGEGLEATGGNIYEKGITGKEVLTALDKGLNITLNSHIVKQDSKLKIETATASSPGVIGQKLTEIVKHLEAAKTYSDSKEQKAQIDASIRYFKTGEIEDFRQANIHWVKDRSNSIVDFMIGWTEVYEDWLARVGSWASNVQIVDPEVSKIAQKLAGFAQHFEDNMPYGKFKKKFAPDYSPPAMMVYYFQERSIYRSGGYNLPNFDDIRRDVGAKNVIRLPLPGETEDPQFKKMWTDMLTEFMPKAKVTPSLEKREKAWRVLVLLHEIIGHGSGTYDESKFAKGQDPISALGSLGSALEEQRADLTALVFGGDEKVVETGIYKDKNEAKETLHAMYDLYLADFMRRTSGQRTFTEAHQRGHWLYINKLLESGAIEWAAKVPGKKLTPETQVLAVKDYDLFHKTSVDLLSELQRIKANRDDAALKTLFEKYAPLDDIHKPWAQAIIKRGANLLINAGYVEQPWKVTSSGTLETFGGTSLTLESIAPFWSQAD